MGLEGPMIGAVVARLENPQVNLAAYGGVVFPVALVIEAPIIMLLAASTALSRDRQSYTRLLRFAHGLSAMLTVLHALIVFTPLYHVVVVGVMGVPEVIVGPSRIGLAIMLPWTWAIAYRRFNQGVLIRFGYSGAVGMGTVVRLAADAVVLVIGYSIGSIQGIVVAACAIVTGVICEAAYARWRVAPVIRARLRHPPSAVAPLHNLGLRALLTFYIPLSLTSLLGLLVQPVGSAAMSRLPLALPSLAVWPVVTGVSFLLRSPGFAFNEVVVALLDEPGAARRLARFTRLLIAGSTAGLVVLLIPPVGRVWFEVLVGLPPALARLAERSLVFALPVPAFAVLQSLYQGFIVDSRRTRGISEAVVVSLSVTSGLLVGAVLGGSITGIYAAMAAFTAGDAARTVWLRVRSKPAMEARLAQQRASV